MTKIFSVIVTYNGVKWINKCLESLRNSSFLNNIIVIDNGSADGTQEAVKKFAGVQFIQNKKNNGFAAANNEGIKIAINQHADFVFLLNQDAWVENNTIEKLCAAMEKNPEFGIISPMHLNGNYSALDIKFANYLIPENCPEILSDIYTGNKKNLYEINFVNAAAWFIKAACIKKTGLLEPLFFFYGEDNNYLQRVRFYNYKTGITPDCTICHDREIRKGELHLIKAGNFERAQSLIILLNILQDRKKVIAFFYKERLRLILKYLYQQKFSLIKYQFRELFFCFFNMRKITSRRKYYLLPEVFN